MVRRTGLSGRRQRENKCRPALRRILHPEASVMGGGEFFCDTQPQPGMAFVRVGGFHAVEAVKYMRFLDRKSVV